MDWSHLPLDHAQRAEQIFHQLRQRSDAKLQEIASLPAGKPDDQLLGETEFEVRDFINGLGADAIQTAVKPHCGEAAWFVSYRDGDVVSLLEVIRLERDYYHCKRCCAGFCP